MSFKTILVHVGSGPGGADPLKAALSLGWPIGATVVGIGAVAWDPYVDPTLGYVNAHTVRLLRNDVDTDIAAAEKIFHAACQRYPHPAIWRSTVEYPTEAIIGNARCADLIVTGHRPKDADLRRYVDPTDVAMRSGLPVLLTPAGQETVGSETVVVGWKNTRETRRAITNALPLLKAAKRVVVVQVCKDENEVCEAEAALEDVVQRLERHGVIAEWQTFPQMGVEPDQDLQDVAKSWAADIVVLGAYGHSRLREWALGGVTRDVLAGCLTMPVLLNH